MSRFDSSNLLSSINARANEMTSGTKTNRSTYNQQQEVYNTPSYNKGIINSSNNLQIINSYHDRSNFHDSINKNLLMSPRVDMLNSYVKNPYDPNNPHLRSPTGSINPTIIYMNTEDTYPQRSNNNINTFRSNKSMKTTKSKKLKEEKQLDNYTEKITDELTDNLNLMKLQLTKELRKVQHQQKVFEVNDLMNEFGTFSDVFKSNLLQNEKKRSNEVDKAKRALVEVKEDIDYCLKDDYNKNYELTNILTKQVKDFKKNMDDQIARITVEQKHTLEQIGHFVMNYKGDERSKLLSKKLLSGDYDEFVKNKDSVTRVYAKPTRKDFKDAMKDLKQKGLRKKKSGTMMDEIDDLHNNKEFRKHLENKKTINKKLQEDIENDVNKDQKEMMDINNVHAKRNIADKIKLKRKLDAKKPFHQLMVDLNHIDYEGFELRPMNRLRAVIYAAILAIKLRRGRNEFLAEKKKENLKHFCRHFAESENELKNWFMESTKNSWVSIFNFENLKIDLSEEKNVFGKVSGETKEKFIKLEIRLKGIVDQMIENTKENSFNLDIINFLKILTADESYTPLKYFYSFELARLEIQSGSICNLNFMQGKMLVIFLFFFKIFLKIVITEQYSRAKSINVKKNLKMIGSVFYHTIIEHFKSEYNIVNNNVNECVIDQEGYNVCSNFDNIYFYQKIVNKGDEIGSDKAFMKRVEEWINKKESLGLINKNDEEHILLNQINPKLDFYSNEDNNDIHSLSVNFYKLNQMQAYFALAKQNNFDLMNKVLEWFDCVIGIINT